MRRALSGKSLPHTKCKKQEVEEVGALRRTHRNKGWKSRNCRIRPYHCHIRRYWIEKTWKKYTPPAIERELVVKRSNATPEALDNEH